jgi:dihydropteroate synthase
VLPFTVQHPRGSRIKVARGFEFDKPEDYVVIALAWATEGAQLVDDARLKPDKGAVLIGVALEANRACPSIRGLAAFDRRPY